MTSRDVAFLRKSRECEAIDQGDGGARQRCAAEMVLEFPDTFTEHECADIAAILDGYPGARDRCVAGIDPWLAGYRKGSDWRQSETPFGWNGDHGGGSLNANLYGPDPGVVAA